MKKIFLALLIALSFDAFSQDQKTAPPTECPTGEHPHLAVNLFNIRLHRAKKDCESGFGVCCTNGGCFQMICVPDNIVPKDGGVPLKYKNDNYVLIGVKDNVIHFYIPKSIKDLDAYKNENISIFYVDEPVSFTYLEKERVIEIGEYNVSELEDYYFVEMKIK